MTIAQLRQEIKERIDHLDEASLRSAADFLGYLDQRLPRTSNNGGGAEHPDETFDAQSQATVMDRIEKFRQRLEREGRTFTRQEIREAIEYGRR